jgi:hypothetical protein
MLIEISWGKASAGVPNSPPRHPFQFALRDPISRNQFVSRIDPYLGWSSSAARAALAFESKAAASGANPRLQSTVTSELAARRMEAYMDSKGIGQTELARIVGTTDRTLRTFRKKGKVRRDIFDAIAKAMGTTRERLLNAENTPE